MKKIGIALLIALTVAFLVSASVWEGSASASVSGELPETGYYAATNSFPRNTIVDIVNLENGRSVRVVVAKGLDSPGLLVVLSPGAADAVGIFPDSIGRVRMDQVSEPFGASVLGGSGDPDHDPGARVAADGGIDPALLEEAAAGETRAASSSATAPSPPAPAPAVPVPVPSPELPAPVVPVPAQTPELPAPVVPVPAQNPELPAGIASPVEESAAKSAVTLTEPSDHTVNPEGYEFTLEPSEPRIPVTPDPFISPGDIASASPASPAQPPREYAIDPAMIIPPVRERGVDAENAAPFSMTPPPSAMIPSIPEVSPSAVEPMSSPRNATLPSIPEIAPPAAQPQRSFSVPVISGLEKGRYYIQVAALSRPDSIESEIKKIDSSLPMAVQSISGAEKPVYRLLIGPVNLGESGALLTRYRTLYKDAFVRLGS